MNKFNTNPALQSLSPSPTPSCRRETNDDRRNNSLRTALHSFYRKRRHGPRRTTESIVNRYVDIHSNTIMWLAFGTCILSLLDAFFTTILLNHGSEELNPVMNAALQQGFEIFLLSKLSITVFCISALVTLKNYVLFKCVSGYQLLIGSFIVYLALICYELTMIRHIPLF